MSAPTTSPVFMGWDSAGQQDLIFWVLTALSTGMMLVLTGLIVYFCIRYRSGGSRRRAPAPRHVTATEMTWLAGTLFIFVGVSVWSNIVFYRARAAPQEAYTVYVVGKRWMWKLEHPSGRREINELHVPSGQPVRLVLASDDVIHSFFIPDFRIKQDVVPGRYTSLWFEAREPGAHHLFCAEYCGAEHSGMVGRVVVLPPAEFERWLSDRPMLDKPGGVPGTPEAPLVIGQTVFDRFGCAACHTRTGSVLAPRLDGLWGRETVLRNGRRVIVDENYLRESILDPNAKIAAGYAAPSLMPSYAGALSEEELARLIEYIRSIRFGWPASEDFTEEGTE